MLLFVTSLLIKHELSRYSDIAAINKIFVVLTRMRNGIAPQCVWAKHPKVCCTPESALWRNSIDEAIPVAKHEKEKGSRYVKAALENIKDNVDLSELYIGIHGKPPSDRTEYYRFRNRFMPSRSNPGCDLLGLCVANSPELQKMTLKEFFRVSDEKESRGKAAKGKNNPATNAK